MYIGTWLHGLGLEQYEPVFRDNAIDLETLPDLTETDLEKLGVLLGHRKRMLRAIDDLPAATAPAGASEPAIERPAEAERRQLTVMFAIWLVRPRCRRALIPRICARSSAPTIAASPTPSPALAVLLPSIWATGC